MTKKRAKASTTGRAVLALTDEDWQRVQRAVQVLTHGNARMFVRMAVLELTRKVLAEEEGQK